MRVLLLLVGQAWLAGIEACRPDEASKAQRKVHFRCDEARVAPGADLVQGARFGTRSIARAFPADSLNYTRQKKPAYHRSLHF